MKLKLKKLEKECNIFNKKYPVGTAVYLKKDFVDEPIKTIVEREAFILSGHSAVAFFHGISGCYLISHVRGLV